MVIFHGSGSLPEGSSMAPMMWGMKFFFPLDAKISHTKIGHARHGQQQLAQKNVDQSCGREGCRDGHNFLP